MADSDDDFQDSPPPKKVRAAGASALAHALRFVGAQRPLHASPASNKQSRAGGASHAGGAKSSVLSHGGRGTGAAENATPAPRVGSGGAGCSPPGVAPGRDRAWGARPLGDAGPARAPPGVDVAAVVERLRRSKAQVRYASWLDSRPASHTAPPGFVLPPELAAVLGRVGALPLYSHQAAAISAALNGKDVVVCTPTASGKSLWCVLRKLRKLRKLQTLRRLRNPELTLSRRCALRSYLAPLLYNLSADDTAAKQGYALMLFPLKALAQDQMKCASLAPRRCVATTALPCCSSAQLPETR